MFAGVGEFLFVFFGLLDGIADFGFDGRTGARIELAGAFDDGIEVVVGGFGDAEGGGGESRDLFAVDNHADDEVAIVHLDEVGGFEGGFELFDKEWSVVGGDTERNSGTDVAEDGVADAVGHLGDVLVGDGEV